MQGTQVAIVDPHQLSREGLKALLAGETYDVISATTSLAAALLEIEGGVQPRLLILTLPDAGETFESAALRQIRALVPNCKIVFITGTSSASLLARVMEWGGNAVLRSDMSMDVLVRSLHLVMLGQDIFPASSSARTGAEDSLADSVGIADQPTGRRLSERENHILQNLLFGYSNKTIARELNISEATVKVHLKAVLRKLNLRNRTQAAIWAAAHGYTDKSTGGSPPAGAHGSGIELVA